MPAGQSGHPMSPFYFDQNEIWRTGQYRTQPFSRGAVSGRLEAPAVCWFRKASSSEFDKPQGSGLTYEQLLICSIMMMSATWSRSTSPASGRFGAALVQPDAVQGLADTFSALGDPTRVRILDALSHGELCVCDLAAVLRLSQSAVSHQLRLLRGLRLVRPRRDGRVVFYSLDDQHIISLFRQTLQHVEEYRRRPPEPRRAKAASR